jgi:hypothetical protein
MAGIKSLTSAAWYDIREPYDYFGTCHSSTSYQRSGVFRRLTARSLLGIV